MKLKDKTKGRIFVLIGAICFFAIHWLCRSVDCDSEIDKAKHANVLSQISAEVRDSRIAHALQDYDEARTLCASAIAVYVISIAGLIYFDRRERRE